MYRVVQRVLSAALLVGLLALPARAPASSWSAPVGGAVVLRFAETWRDPAGRPRSHGGLDLEAEPGAPVRACTGGTVAFAGRVPSSGGGTTLAVTVLTSDGLKVTYIPMASAEVSVGAVVAEGDLLGLLAGSGDGSWSAPHLHMSVRRGGREIDPEPLLDPGVDPGPASAPAPGPAAPAASPPTPPPAAVTAPALPAPAARPAPAPSPAPAATVAAVRPAPAGALAAGAATAVLARPHTPRLEAHAFPPRTAGRWPARLPGMLRPAAGDPRSLALRVALAIVATLALMRALPRAGAPEHARAVLTRRLA
jgi:hypothetical protein